MLDISHQAVSATFIQNSAQPFVNFSGWKSCAFRVAKKMKIFTLVEIKISRFLCVYLTGLPPRSVSFILLYAHKIIEKEFKETIFQKSILISGWKFRPKKTKMFAFGPELTVREKTEQKISSRWTYKCYLLVKRINPNE